MLPQLATISEANQQLNSQEYLARKIELSSYPFHIQIGADNRCNLRCPFCLAAAYREKGFVHLQDRRLEKNPVELFERLEPYMKYWKYLSLTGPGESLINPELGRILTLVRRASECVVLITTNAVLIDARLAELFVEKRVDEISISIESLKKELYESLRVNARFEAVMAAIDLVNETKRKHGSELPRINLTPNFSRRNIEELPDFIRFAHAKGVSAVQATPTQVYRRSWVKDSLLHYPGLTRRYALMAEKLAAELGVSFANELRMVYLNRGRGLLSFLKEREAVDFPTEPSLCQKPWTSIYVEPDGQVRPCCYLSPVYGNLYEKSFEEVWNGSEAQSLRAAMVSHYPPRQCRHCYEFNRDDPSIMIQLDFEHLEEAAAEPLPADR
ncbi:MAG: radical SAM protein [Acidobacteria bacterium]|nr:MAG: radical SAM protein [Acidobacteriota bacterium]